MSDVSPYELRPWSARYDEGQPSDVEVEPRSVLEVAEHLARVNPSAQCVHFFDQSFTRGEVTGHAKAFAASLRQAGIGVGDRVALYLQNVPEFVVALLGIWHAGAIAVLVNPMYKDRELALVLDDSGASGIVCMESLVSTVRALSRVSELNLIATVPDAVDAPRPGGPISVVGEGGAQPFWALARWDGDRLSIRPDPTAPGCLVYTSGTTGPPKGALNTHDRLLFSSRIFQRWMPLDQSDVVLAIAPMFHITGLVAHLTAALVSGAPLVLLERFTAERAVEQARLHRATYTVAAITAFVAIMNAKGDCAARLETLTKIYSGGAPVAPALIEQFESRFGHYIHPIYGLTESTSPAVITPAGRRAPVDSVTGALSIGVPVYNTVIRVVDDAGSEVPVGEVGEFLIEGPQVVEGYWGKPEESARAVAGGKLRTGDVGYMDAAGWFYLIDRKKDLINASGYKVWPREVEDVLYEHTSVREAAVVGIPDPYRGETVKAFVSLRPDAAQLVESELIQFCRARLAAYKYPRQIEIVDDLPKTPSGKILRRALRGIG